MTTIHTRTRVGPDGKIVVPIGVDEAGKEVSVTIIPVDAPDTINGIPRAEWFARFERTAGSIDDETFRRPPPLPHKPPAEFDD
ncbi:MAG TPA: hypothetical protein VH518_21905 [Tepidisphaeraceae bacterium]|jgi:hypothetical protein